MASSKTSKKVKAISTPALITMQWLTYVFWALTSVAIVFLVSVITEYLIGIDSETPTESVAYAVAAAFILLPIAFTLDVFFSRYEDKNKSSASSIVMVVHSVIFAIVSIGALVTAVFNIINMLLNSFNDKGVWIAVAASVAVFITFAILFARTTKHNLFNELRVVYRYFILASVLVASIIALTGPFARALETKDTRLVRENLIQLTGTISEYAYANNKLPASLESLVGFGNYSVNSNKNTLNDLLEKNLLKYTPDIKASETLNGTKVYYYELCGVYGNDLKSGNNIAIPMIYSEYPSYLSIYDVKAGTTCYKLSTDSSYKTAPSSAN